MHQKTITPIILAALLSACESAPSQPDAAREAVTTRHARIIQRTEVSDANYDQLRHSESADKAARESIAKTGMLFGAIGGALGGVLVSSDEVKYPQRYKFVVRLDSSQTLDVIDTFPFSVGQCVRVAKGVNTGNLSLIPANSTSECAALP